ncbi:MAG: hypothetical protein U0527_06650 [Candidatus Eisenbacteria bacterium]
MASVGALADPATATGKRARRPARAARASAFAALGGLDALGAARLAGLDEVTYVSRKPPAAWRGTAAESLVDLAAVREPTVFLATTAREAARRRPAERERRRRGRPGRHRARSHARRTGGRSAGGRQPPPIPRAAGHSANSTNKAARVLPDNPKSSRMAPMSLLAALAREGAELVIGWTSLPIGATHRRGRTARSTGTRPRAIPVDRREAAAAQPRYFASSASAACEQAAVGADRDELPAELEHASRIRLGRRQEASARPAARMRRTGVLDARHTCG